MRDILFFPIAAVLASTFIFVALDPYAERLPSGAVSGGGRNAQDLTVKDTELNRFIVGDVGGISLDLIRPDGGQPFLRIDRQASATYENLRLGPHLVLAEDMEVALESRPIEVIIEARSVGDFAASAFEANYLARAGNESGWQEFPLTREFQSYTLSYFTPRRGRDEGYNFIGIRPVAPDKHRVMDVRSVRIRSAGNKGTPPLTQRTGPVIVP
jgi:hypothetical protein